MKMLASNLKLVIALTFKLHPLHLSHSIIIPYYITYSAETTSLDDTTISRK